VDNLKSLRYEALPFMKISAVSVSFLFGRTALILILMFLSGPAFAKRKDDVVVMKNGDRFTGEIKGLQHGELIFKAAYMVDSVRLDWNRVERLESKDSYIVALSSGARVTGNIERETIASEPRSEVRIVAPTSTIAAKPTEVIAIQQSEVGFWNQLTGSINYGFNFSSGNSSTNSSLGANVAYNTAKNSVQLSTTSQFDPHSQGKNTNRFTFDSQYARVLSGKWIAAGLFSLLKSNQQDLQLRSTYGGGFGRKLIQTDSTSLLAIGGAVYTHENYQGQPGTSPIRNNAESLVGLTFSTFRFRTANINSQLLVFPSLTDPGRVRLTSQSNLQIELVRNFSWNFQFYENVDSRPPVNAPKNDLGITTSLGWKF
jgi:putative salt-induced outer membrane protein YdiY